MVHRCQLSSLRYDRLKLIFRSSSKVRCLITTISQDVTSSDQELSTSGKPSRVRQWTVDWADGRMVRRRDQEARCSGMLFPNVHFSWSIGEGEGSLGGFLPRGRMGHQGVSQLTRSSRSKLICSGQSDLEEPIAIRPTSETVMYPCKSSLNNRARD
jgi:hypothetical protein